MKTPVRILHVDYNPKNTELIQTVLEADGVACAIIRVDTRMDYLQALKRNRFDIIISEYSLPSLDGPSALTIANKEYPYIPFIFFVDNYDEDAVVECLKNGARDFVMKKNVAWLALVIGHVLHEAEDHLERQRAEEALKASQEYAQSIIDSSLDMIVSADKNRRIVEFNRAAEETFGYSREEVMGQHVDILYAQPRQGLCIHKTTVLNGRCVEEVLNKRKNGEVFRSILSASILCNSRGELTGVMGVSRDITDSKKVEARLREQAALLDIAQDAIIIHDMKNRITYWNKSAERVYGWNVGEALGKTIDVLLSNDKPDEMEEYRNTCVQKGEWRGDLRQKANNGREVIVESRWTLVRDVEEEPKSILIVNTDTTEAKKMESQLLRAQRMESIGTLAGGIAHDLNNVLTPIVSGLQIIRRKVTDEQGRRLLTTLEGSAKRGTDIVKQVLTFARGAEGERVVLQPRHLVREIEKIIRETFPKSVQIVKNIVKDLWTVLGDATQLHQVLLNLCVNARDAMPDGGTLTLSAENIMLDESYARMNLEAKPGPYVVITVIDTGSGIPPGIIDKIFEPFFTTKEIGKGTGLGLATVMALVKSHGGFLNVYSEVNKGTTFKIYLPAADAGEMQQEEEESRLEMFSGNGELVLVVDDEESILEITKEILETYGYKVITAVDGTEAVAIVADKKGLIDVVITDMMMPYMDGVATIRALKKIDPSLAIIATSGLGVDRRITEVLSLGGAFLTKPFTADKLLTTLHEVVNLNNTAEFDKEPSDNLHQKRQLTDNVHDFSKSMVPPVSHSKKRSPVLDED